MPEDGDLPEWRVIRVADQAEAMDQALRLLSEGFFLYAVTDEQGHNCLEFVDEKKN